MIGVLMATRMEAQPLLDRVAARKVSGRPFKTYEYPPAAGRPGGTIVVSGMGKRRAARAAEYLIAECGAAAVYSVGICGSLTDKLPSGSLIRVSAVVDGDEVLAGRSAEELACVSEDRWAELPAARLASVAVPVFEAGRRQTLSARADVVDMEARAVAEVCRRHGVPIFALKGVTDLADGAGKLDIVRNLRRVSAALADVVSGGPIRRQVRVHRAGRAWRAAAGVMRFAKVEHTLFSLPLLVAGAWLGAGGRWPAWSVLVLIALAGVGARTLGMSMNRIFDRRLDGLNRRTAGRELPSGRMRLPTAFAVAGGGLAVYLAACAGLGRVCLILSPVPAVPLMFYSLLKRFTNLCHFGIGLCLALAPLGAFVAASGGTAATPAILLLTTFTFLWMSGFDVIYAIQDLDSDRQTGVRSLPASLGAGRAQAIAAGLHAGALAALVWLWRLGGGGAGSGAALVVAAGGFAAAYWPAVPLAARFFPISAVVGLAASLVCLLGELP